MTGAKLQHLRQKKKFAPKYSQNAKNIAVWRAFMAHIKSMHAVIFF
jgi:hypothetical protein